MTATIRLRDNVGPCEKSLATACEPETIMEHMPTIMSVMTPFPHAIAGGRTLADARDMMTERGIHHLPVIDDGTLLGIVSMRDIRVISVQVEAWQEIEVKTICARKPYVVEHSTPLPEAVRGMATRHLGTVLVTRAGKLVGILTTTDLCRLLGQALTRLYPPDDVA